MEEQKALIESELVISRKKEDKMEKIAEEAKMSNKVRAEKES